MMLAGCGKTKEKLQKPNCWSSNWLFMHLVNVGALELLMEGQDHT